MSILTIVPSRGRPDRLALMVESYRATARLPGTTLIAVYDQDDPALPEYERVDVDHMVLKDREGYTYSLNAAARDAWDDVEILGAFGDDVLFRTPGWDERVEEVLTSPGIAYGNDLVHAAGHPTAIWMSSTISRALGWLALPYSRHLWVDDAWKILGQQSGTLRYMPDVIAEHMHPAVGKAEMDQTYHEVYDGALGHRDHMGYLAWVEHNLEDDVAKVKHAAVMWEAARSDHYAYAAPRAE